MRAIGEQGKQKTRRAEVQRASGDVFRDFETKTYGGEKGAISGAVFSVRLLGYGYTVHYRSWCSRGIET